MTDQDRARALASALLGPVGLTEEVLGALAQAFAEVRRDERGAVATVVRGYGEWTTSIIERVALTEMAARIERGDHECAAGGAGTC